MTRSRIIIWLAVFVATATPLFLLSRVTYGVRYGILAKIYSDADMMIPPLAQILWPLGPLDWWSYLTPISIATGVAAKVPAVVRTSVLSALLTFSFVQGIVIYGAFVPFWKLGAIMGHPAPTPYPTLPLVINVGTVAASLLFAVHAIRSMKKTNKS